MITMIRNARIVSPLFFLAILPALALALVGPALARTGGQAAGQTGTVEFPKSPAGDRARGLFDLFNGKMTIEPKDFVRENCSEGFKSRVPENSWGGAIQQIKAMAAPYDLASIDRSDPNGIAFTIRSKSKGMAFAIEVAVEPQAPHLISGMMFRPAGPAAGAPAATPAAPKPQAPPHPPDMARIKIYLEEQARAGRFSGTALVAKDGQPLLLESAGFASKRFKAPNNADTQFSLGSLNKSFTAVAVLQLVEAGLVGIDDPIGKYLDFFPKDVGEKVKVRHLLDMSSGWGDYWENPYFLQHKYELRSLADYMAFIKDIPLDFEPGTGSQHSNTGYEVAGALIEKVSGMDYFAYVREKIYRPAGMTDTDSYDRDGPYENLAVGYTNMHPLAKGATDFRWENTYILSRRGTPAGGGYSTAGDMLKYDTALRGDKLLGKGYVDFLNSRFQGKIGDPFTPPGVQRSAGGANGVSTFFGRDLRYGYTIIVLTNVDNPVAIDIGNEIIKILGL
jgi:CubicO group peptidase (beta-lactamase class C family)